MSEDRSLPPSARRLRKAREEGRVAFTPELAGLLGLFTVSLLLEPGVTAAFSSLGALGEHLLLDAPEPGVALLETASTLAALLGPLLLGLGLGGVALGLVQTRGLLTLHPLRPRLSRLSPTEGWRRLFSLDRLAGPLRGLLLALLALPLFFALGLQLAPELLRLPGSERGLAALPALVRPVLWAGLALTGLSAAIDLAWRRHRHHGAMRMSHRDRREESKQDEGDPRARQERQGQHRRMATSSPPPLDQARVVVLNPTHLAVALHHDHLDELPYVGARATGRPAARVRTHARRAGVPLLRDRPLARALIRLEPGEEIPPTLYEPVAALLASVYRAGLAPPPPASHPLPTRPSR